MHQRHRADHRERTEQDHRRAAADLVGQRAEHRLHQHVDEQRDGHHVAGRLRMHAGRVHEVLLHVRRERVEDQRAASREADYREERALVLPHPADRAGVLLVARFGRRRLVERLAQVQRDQRGRRADHERNAPAPRLQFAGRQRLLQDHEHEQRAQLAADQRHVLERREEAAAALQRHLAHVGRARAVFATHRQPLEQPRDQQQRRRERADLRIGRQHRDHERAAAHHQHRDHHRVAAAVTVGDAAEQPAADRTHQEAGREHARRIQQLCRRVAAREERRREVQRAERVDVEVEPLDEVARRGADDGEHTPPGVMRGQRSLVGLDVHGLVSSF